MISRTRILFVFALPFAACAPATSGSTARVPLRLPEDVVAIDAEGQRLSNEELLGRIAASDFVLLGELHDNPTHHAVRGRLVAAFEANRPAIVFEQFTETSTPIALPAAGEAREAWLDRNGFDREAWSWPLHRPVVDAAIAIDARIWGSGVTRERLRSVVREGESAAPAHLQSIMANNPLDGSGQAILDRELVESHCGQLPESMVTGMRAAQVVRDAAMANTLRNARANETAWLIAGNGHVRRDIAVPRLLRALEPERSVLVIGFLERSQDGAEPDPEARALYDVVIVTPRIERPDPCSAFRIP